MGLPIITSKRMKYLTEFVENNVNGLILEDNDFLVEIEKLIVDKKRLKYMSLQSHKNILHYLKEIQLKNGLDL